MYCNPKIEELFRYAECYEKMLKGDERVCLTTLAYDFVGLICLSRHDLAFILADQAVNHMTCLDQLRLLKILCDIYGKPSSWKNYEGKPKPGTALLSLERKFYAELRQDGCFAFSYAFYDFHDYLHAQDRERVDEEIIMLSDSPLRHVGLWQKTKWFYQRLKFSIRNRKNDHEEVPF